MSKSDKQKIFLFFIFCVIVITIVTITKGAGQIGNALSFLGGIATLVPALSQAQLNRRFAEAIVETTHPDMQQLVQGLVAARRDVLLRFSLLDYYMFIDGMVMLCLGFLVSIILSP